jgi:anti-anti-sigma factor
LSADELNRQGRILTAAPRGRLDRAEADRLCRLIEEQLEAGADRLMLDLSAVVYMTSSALSAFILLLQKVRSAGGSMVVAAPDERIHLLLEVAGLNQLLALYRGREEAWRHLEKDDPG